MDMGEHYLHRTVGNVIQELPVVAHQQESPAAGLQILFQPLDGLDVKVVRGLVKHQQFGLAQKNLGQFDAHVPPLAESIGQTPQLIVLEPEAPESLAGLHLWRFAMRNRKAVIKFREPFYQIGIRLRFIVGSLGKFDADGIDFRLEAGSLAEHGHGLVQHAKPLMVFHNLGQIADGDA